MKRMEQYHLNDFTVLYRSLGSDGRPILLVERKNDGSLFLLFLLQCIINFFRDFQSSLFIERTLLSELDCPYIIKYISTIHENSDYYLMFEPLKYGLFDDYITV